MRRVFALIVSIFLLIVPLTTMVSADEFDEKTVVWYFEDGSYIVENFTIVQSRASGSKTGSRSRTFYGSDGSLDWQVVLTGSFTYTGASATCTSSTCNVTIYDSAWYTVSKSSGKSGNTATASATIGEKLLGVTVRQIPVSLSISCDKNGNLS